MLQQRHQRGMQRMSCGNRHCEAKQLRRSTWSKRTADGQGGSLNLRRRAAASCAGVNCGAQRCYLVGDGSVGGEHNRTQARAACGAQQHKAACAGQRGQSAARVCARLDGRCVLRQVQHGAADVDAQSFSNVARCGGAHHRWRCAAHRKRTHGWQLLVTVVRLFEVHVDATQL